MILWVFVVLLAVSFLLIIIGQINRPPAATVQILGYFFLFLLGFVLLLGELEYVVGSDTVTTFVYDDNASVLSLVANESVVFYNFSDASSHSFGFYMVFLGVAGIVITAFQARRVLN